MIYLGSSPSLDLRYGLFCWPAVESVQLGHDGLRQFHRVIPISRLCLRNPAIKKF